MTTTTPPASPASTDPPAVPASTDPPASPSAGDGDGLREQVAELRELVTEWGERMRGLFGGNGASSSTPDPAGGASAPAAGTPAPPAPATTPTDVRSIVDSILRDDDRDARISQLGRELDELRAAQPAPKRAGWGAWIVGKGLGA